MPRSPRLAHKAPVMQARIRLTASVWTVLLLPLCDQARPWFRFSKRTSSVAGLALCLVAFSRASLIAPFCGRRERYSRPFHWALTLSINTCLVDRAAIEQTEESSQKSEVGNQKWQIVSWKSEVGSRKWEVGSGKWEVGSGRFEGLIIQLWVWTVRNQKSGVRTLSSLKS